MDTVFDNDDDGVQDDDEFDNDDDDDDDDDDNDNEDDDDDDDCRVIRTMIFALQGILGCRCSMSFYVFFAFLLFRQS